MFHILTLCGIICETNTNKNSEKFSHLEGIMENRVEILTKLAEKENLLKELDSLVYGSVEVRRKDNKEYIYVHYREDGISLTKYLGEANSNFLK